MFRRRQQLGIKDLDKTSMFQQHISTTLVYPSPLVTSLPTMMFSSFLVLALGIFASASPTPSQESEVVAVAARETIPNVSVVPLTFFAVFQTLKLAVDALTPGLETIVIASGPLGQTGSVVPLVQELVDALNEATTALATVTPGDAGASDEDLAKLVEDILDAVNTALNKLVPKLGLNGVLAPLDAAVTSLVFGLDTVLPSVLALVGSILIPVGGLVGGILSGTGLAGL
ncbi:hypothetical protein C8J57DRAFT_1460420 [Mycena rebaudengoi]|nr:hypothetical protein C8J57DRAFT_1460420 [Mycena rebaudengoi]